MFLTLVQIYLTTFYGSSLWDLNSLEATKLYSTYNQMIRNTYDLPFGTHRFILREVSDNIQKNTKPEVIHLFHKQKLDSRSVFGRNYKNILILKKGIPAAYKTPENQGWKISLIKEICDVKFGVIGIEDFPRNMLDAILQEICT